MNISKNLPLLIATGLSALTLFGTFITNIAQLSDLYYFYNNEILIGAIALVLVWLSKLINGKVWVYLFLLVLLISFSNLIVFSGFKLSIYINTLEINLITLGLIISHFSLNSDFFKAKDRTAEDINKEFEEKVVYFQNKFSSKTLAELKKLEDNDLVPEAKEAIIRLINKHKVQP